MAEAGTEPAVDREERRVTASVDDRVAVLTHTARTCPDGGIAIEDIGVRRPTLDEAFLRLTGHRTHQHEPERGARKRQVVGRCALGGGQRTRCRRRTRRERRPHGTAAIALVVGNPVPHGGSWIEEHAWPMAVVRPPIVTAIFLPLAVRRFQTLGR